MLEKLNLPQKDVWTWQTLIVKRVLCVTVKISPCGDGMNWIYLYNFRNILNFWLWVILIHSHTNHGQCILKSKWLGETFHSVFNEEECFSLFSEFLTLKSIFTFKTPWFRFAGLRWGNGEECLSFFAEFSIFPRISQTSSHVAGKLQNSEQKMHW